MKTIDLLNKLNEYMDSGFVDADAEVEFLLDGDDFNCGSSILNTMIIRDGDDNNVLFLTNFEKVIR